MRHRLVLTATVLTLSLSAGRCIGPTSVGDGCEWVDPPPVLQLCEPGEVVLIDENLIASCDALTQSTGDWILETDQKGREFCNWRPR